MASSPQKGLWKPRLQRWLTFGLAACVIVLSVLAFTLSAMSNDSSRLNARQVFESSRWNALQLQLQAYRLMNYVVDLSADDLPLNGQGYFQYDLMLSRVDLLRQGEIGNHIRTFGNGRAVRLLNIITGELELISLNIEHLEQGRISQVPIILERLKSLDSQISDFVFIVNQGANEYVSEQRKLLEQRLTYTQNVALGLFVTTIVLVLMAFKVAHDQRLIFARNRRLEARVEAVQEEKTEVIARIVNELRPNITALVGLCVQNGTSPHTSVKDSRRLNDAASMSNHLLTQIDCYQDLTLIESNQMVLQPSKVCLRQQIEHTLESLSNQFTEHHCRVISLVEPRLPQYMETDYGRLHEILSTLLAQILPYAKHSPVVLQVRPSTLPIIETLGAGKTPQKVIQISLRDTGYGLPEDMQTGLRINPHNPANTIAKQIQLIGLGLTFCHRLISAMGGELHFSSASDSGTEIWINIPMGTGEHTAPPAIERAPLQSAILVLESNALAAHALEQGLAAHFTQVTVIDETAFLTGSKQDFHYLLLTDLRLMDNDCIQAVHYLAASGIQIIATEEIADILPELTVHRVLQYPITQSQLDKIISPQE